MTVFFGGRNPLNFDLGAWPNDKFALADVGCGFFPIESVSQARPLSWDGARVYRSFVFQVSRCT